jgi:hypothetical protein
VPCLSCSDDLVQHFFLRWPPILGPGDEQPHLLHVTHILILFARKLTFFLHVREFKNSLMFPAFVHDGNLHYPLIFYWNSPTGRASGVETELVEFQLLVAFPFFPFEDNWFRWLEWQKCVPWRLDRDHWQIFVSFTRVVDYASKSERDVATGYKSKTHPTESQWNYGTVWRLCFTRTSVKSFSIHDMLDVLVY